HLVAERADLEPQGTARGFAEGAALVRRFEAVIDRVAHEVDERRADAAEDLAVEQRVGAVALELHDLRELGGVLGGGLFDREREVLRREQAQRPDLRRHVEDLAAQVRLLDRLAGLPERPGAAERTEERRVGKWRRGWSAP